MMKDRRVENFKAILSKLVKKYEYVESIILISIYLFIGFLLNKNDICMLHYKFPAIFVLLAILVLFYGLEIGIFSMSIFTLILGLFYKPFPMEEFLSMFIMTLIFGQFHYLWMKRISNAELDADYKAEKLNELASAFYSLKISHDQLEKNYIIKPMSIRLILEELTNELLNFKSTGLISANKMLYSKLLEILKQSFNLQKGLIIFAVDIHSDVDIDNVSVVSLEKVEYSNEDIFKNYLVEQAIARKKPIYISHENTEETEFIAAIPTIYKNKVVNVLLIEEMPFTSFERENLTSIAIVLEFVTNEVLKYYLFGQKNEYIDFINDRNFKFEINRLLNIYEKFNKTSTLLVFILDDEIDAIKLYELIEKMLRALDKVIYIEEKNRFYVIVLFPLNEKQSALGFLNRLDNSLPEGLSYKDHMIFDFSRLDLFKKYIMRQQIIKEERGIKKVLKRRIKRKLKGVEEDKRDRINENVTKIIKKKVTNLDDDKIKTKVLSIFKTDSNIKIDDKDKNNTENNIKKRVKKEEINKLDEKSIKEKILSLFKKDKQIFKDEKTNQKIPKKRNVKNNQVNLDDDIIIINESSKNKLNLSKFFKRDNKSNTENSKEKIKQRLKNIFPKLKSNKDESGNNS